MKSYALLILLFASIMADVNSSSKTAKEAETLRRKQKLLPIFQVYSFRNLPCVGGTKNGTCYTAQECTDKGGTSEGGCASNFGVCCTFTRSCGSTSSENCTYFESNGVSAGGCSLRICKCSNDICQLRLDFNQFTITGPSTDTNAIGAAINGILTPGAANKAVSTASQCLTDTFSVTNPSGNTPPTICGINTGEHMYVDASDSCNDLAFQLGTNGVGTGIQNNRQWSIKISQYSCDYNNLAPDGCTQYFFGSTVDTVMTYNWAGGQHIANQEQQICVRRERGNCRICWTTTMDTDFAVSGLTNIMTAKTAQTACCGYGASGLKTTGFDCLSIPGAVKTTAITTPTAIRRCGRGKLFQTAGAAMNPGSVCSDRTPFYIRFASDNYEYAAAAIGEASAADAGFMLTYIQSANNC